MKIRSIKTFIITGLLCGLPAMGADLTRVFTDKAVSYYAEAVKLRRELHRIPEPCFQEVKTAAFIAGFHEKLGYRVEKGIAGTGMKAVLTGSRAKPVIGIRTDMDALPITEKTGLEFASRNPGFMHACGHDVHMTNVLMAARLLSEVRSSLPGTVVFIFQPCEEGAPGDQPSGATVMTAAGVLENPHIDAMIGLHLLPELPLGTVGLRPGAVMANVSSIEVVITGQASHGAFPHQGVDAIYAAAQAIDQFQSLISRRKDPGEKAVLTIGMISGGVRENVLADRVEMRGTVRSFSNATERMIEEGLEKILQGLDTGLGTRHKLAFMRSNRTVQNDPALVDFFRPLLRRLLGEKGVVETEPLTIAEDFSVFSHRLPSLFFFLGTGKSAPLHSPEFQVDEALLKTAPAIFATLAAGYLARK